MKSLKVLLMGASAIGLIVGTSVAFAGDSNTLYIDQSGGGNQANVQQSAGPGGNDIGTSASPFLQDGNNNIFTEQQQTGGGFLHGDNDIVQGSQVGDNNKFTNVYNNNAGNNRINLLRQNGDNNLAIVTRNASVSGIIGTLTEDGDKNFLQITQNGAGNEVTSATITGSNNGFGPGNLSNWGIYITQSGTNNLVSESSINGSNNNSTNDPSQDTGSPVHFIKQSGDDNGRAASIARTLGSNGNGISITEIGSSNNFDIRQGLSSASTGNYATLTQTGDLNLGTATQFGDFNQMTASQVGSGNVVHVNQSGNNNSSTTLFTGDNNGVGTMTGIAGTLVSANSSLLSQGTVLQDSSSALSGNTLSYTVNGSNNLFAFAQVGGGNSITGTVSSDSNQVAVLQTGSHNTTTFTQTGGANNAIAVHQ